MSSEELQSSRIYKQGNTTVFSWKKTILVSLYYKEKKTYETQSNQVSKIVCKILCRLLPN